MVCLPPDVARRLEKAANETDFEPEHLCGPGFESPIQERQDRMSITQQRRAHRFIVGQHYELDNSF